MFITPNLIDNVTTLTTFEALGNLKSQTPKLSHTLINSVAIQPYPIQHPLCQLAAKHYNNFVGFQHFCLCVSDDPFSTYPAQVQGSKLMKESVTQIWIMLLMCSKQRFKSQCVNWHVENTCIHFHTNFLRSGQVEQEFELWKWLLWGLMKNPEF